MAPSPEESGDTNGGGLITSVGIAARKGTVETLSSGVWRSMDDHTTTNGSATQSDLMIKKQQQQQDEHPDTITDAVAWPPNDLPLHPRTRALGSGA